MWIDFDGMMVKTQILYRRKNYEEWRVKMIGLMKAGGVWDVIEKGIVTEDKLEQGYTEDQVNAIAMTLMYRAVQHDEIAFDAIGDTEVAKEA